MSSLLRTITLKYNRRRWEVDVFDDGAVVAYVHVPEAHDYQGREETHRGRWDLARGRVDFEKRDPSFEKTVADALRRVR